MFANVGSLPMQDQDCAEMDSARFACSLAYCPDFGSRVKYGLHSVQGIL